MSYDSNAEKVRVQNIPTTNNVEITIGESRRIWMTPDEAKLVLEGLKRMLKL